MNVMTRVENSKKSDVFIYNVNMSDTITIILCSDNHSYEAPLQYLKQAYPQADYFLHCGDCELPKRMMEGFACVQGNNDHYGDFPPHLILHIGEHHIYLTHGHRDMMFNQYEMLAAKAKANGCDIACCGHTHMPFAKVIDGVTCLNPGSIWHNRDGSSPTYMILTLNGPEISWEKKVYKM